jgi:predicted double-glycine peptidase
VFLDSPEFGVERGLMAWAILVLLGLLFTASWAAGVWIGGRSKPVALAVAALTSGLILLRALFRFLPDIEYPLLSSNLYSAIRPWWVFPFALVLLGIGARRMRQRPLRAAAGIAALGAFLFALQQPWAWATFDPSEFTGKPDCDGVCRQTQDYTCGAAAAATLLAHLGIGSDEREMARLCGSTPLTGTDELAVCSGLRAKLKDSGYSVAVERPNPDRLERHLRPVMARMRAGAFRDHWVVLFAINDQTAVLGDPVEGKTVIPADEFYRTWRGSVVSVNRPFSAAYAVR